jgi:hypothetical protein
MAPEYHAAIRRHRKAFKKELSGARGMTLMLARQSDDLRARGEGLIRETRQAVLPKRE